MQAKHVIGLVLVALILFCLIGWSTKHESNSQLQRIKKFDREALVEHKARSVKVTANHPRPLERVITGVNEEYGWAVNYEDPPYFSDSELVDNTDAEWRRSHLGGRGSRIPAGGVFQGEYPEDSTTGAKVGEETLLQMIASSYNQSGNPGKFALRAEENQFEIIGVSIKDNSGVDKSVSPILDTRISIPVAQRSAFATIEAILKAVSVKTGVSMSFGTVPMNILAQSQVSIGGTDVTARHLLSGTIARTHRTISWSLLYDANNPGYFLNLSVAARALRDTYGRKTLIPIDSSTGR